MLNNVKQTENDSDNENKQCSRMKKIKLITKIKSYIEFATEKTLERCTTNKVLFTTMGGKVLVRTKDIMNAQILPLIFGFFCSKTSNRITKNNNKYFYNGVIISKKNLTSEMINVTKWILLDYRQKNNKIDNDDIEDMIDRLNSITDKEIKIIYNAIDKKV